MLREEFINETMEDSTKLQTFKKIMELIEAIDSDPEIKNEFRNMAGKVK